jgi:hypothetical protein
MKELINIRLNEKEQDKIQRLIYSIMKKRKLLIPEEENFIIDNEYYEMINKIEEFIKTSNNIAIKENEF